MVDKAEKTADGAVITFSHADGLHFDGDPADLQVYDFERKLLPYTAAIEGDTLRITADGIFRITMGFCNSPTHNLYNAAGCLASPFELIL